MSTSFTTEMQCTHSEFLRLLPMAIDHRPYEIVDNVVTVFDGDRTIEIVIHDEPIRHLGSLNLPMEKIEVEMPDYNENEAKEFHTSFRNHILKAGGG